jgi:hypothetical protein
VNHSTPRSASPGKAPPSRRARRARSGDGVLSIKAFRRLWIALSLSSLGDWLSILALIALAPSVTHGCPRCCSGRSRARWPTGSTAGPR